MIIWSFVPGSRGKEKEIEKKMTSLSRDIFKEFYKFAITGTEGIFKWVTLHGKTAPQSAWNGMGPWNVFSCAQANLQGH